MSQNMELWYTDQHTQNVHLTMKVKNQIASLKSEFQRIDILDTIEFGKVLVLDGELFITEKDEFIYHEMITHVPMAVHPHVENVLVVGSGDGGTVRELTKYDTIKNIDMVDIDREVTNMCLEYFKETSCKLDDPRVHMYFEEGLRFVRMKKDEYDLIIVDSSDPYGPAEGLFTREFYGTCFKALHEDGILINQHESPYYSEHSRSVQKAHRNIHKVFPLSTVYQCHIPSYPSGHWLFGFASKKYDPIKDLRADDWNNLNLKTRYYNTDLHMGSFTCQLMLRIYLAWMMLKA